MSYIQPMNYTVNNESEVSDAFAETGMDGSVKSVPPVVYPNARTVESSEGDESNPLKLSADVARKSQQVNRFYNDVASGFRGMITGYNGSTQGLSYEMPGGTIDLFA